MSKVTENCVSDDSSVFISSSQPIDKNSNSKKASSVLKIIGVHPEGGDIQLMNGRFGPYIKYKKSNISIKNKDNLEDINLDVALELLNNKKKK